MTTTAKTYHSEVEDCRMQFNSSTDRMFRQWKTTAKRADQFWEALMAIKEFEQGDLSDTEALGAVKQIARAAL